VRSDLVIARLGPGYNVTVHRVLLKGLCRASIL
jgi:hypothetical protein